MRDTVFHIEFIDEEHDDTTIITGKAFIIKSFVDLGDSAFDDLVSETEFTYGTLDWIGYTNQTDDEENINLTIGFDSCEIEPENREKVMSIFQEFFVKQKYETSNIFDYDPGVLSLETDTFESFMVKINQGIKN